MNNDTPTPETDAKASPHIGFYSCATVPADFARSLEKERDEAREELARIESLLLDPHAVFLNFLRGKIAKLDWAKLEHIYGPHPARAERDEARDDLEFRRELYALQTERLKRIERERDDARVERENLKDQRDFSMKVIAKLESERDDALSQISQAECRAERFCQERDQFRETLREIKAADWKTSGELRGMARRALEEPRIKIEIIKCAENNPVAEYFSK